VALIRLRPRVQIPPAPRRPVARQGRKDGKAWHSHSGVVQRQDAALLRQLSGFESLRQSAAHNGLVGELGRPCQPVKLKIAGPNPVRTAAASDE
jgi:hypothetical protein